MTLASKLSARGAHIYQQPIDKLACLQADLVNMACSINPTTSEDYILLEDGYLKCLVLIFKL